jgi:hypothetical protein
MPVIDVEAATHYQPQHQDVRPFDSHKLNAKLSHFRQKDDPVGFSAIEITTFFEIGREPYFLIGEEDCEAFNPSSAAVKVTLPDLFEAMFNWSETFDGDRKHGILAMADYLQMLLGPINDLESVSINKTAARLVAGRSTA